MEIAFIFLMEVNNMPFYEALKIMFEQNKSIRRQSWSKEESILYTSMMSRIFKEFTDRYEIWTPKHEDLIANDWEVIEVT